MGADEADKLTVAVEHAVPETVGLELLLTLGVIKTEPEVEPDAVEQMVGIGEADALLVAVAQAVLAAVGLELLELLTVTTTVPVLLEDGDAVEHVVGEGDDKKLPDIVTVDVAETEELGLPVPQVVADDELVAVLVAEADAVEQMVP